MNFFLIELKLPKELIVNTNPLAIFCTYMYLLSFMWRRSFCSSYSAFSLTKFSSRRFCCDNFIWLWKSSFLMIIFQAGICLWPPTSVGSLLRDFKMILQASVAATDSWNPAWVRLEPLVVPLVFLHVSRFLILRIFCCFFVSPFYRPCFSDFNE